jgi:type IV pilus assembly protein PilP
MTIRFQASVCGLCVGAALLTGCAGGDLTDLESYAGTVLAREGGQIEPLPPITPYTPYLYRSASQGSRDPFVSFLQVRRENIAAAEAADSGQQQYADEILTHVAEELESYPLDSMRMMGIIENTDQLFGIVRDPTGTVHRVQVGNYIGTNYGKIMSISEMQIELREIYQDAQGRWEERAASLALRE